MLLEYSPDGLADQIMVSALELRDRLEGEKETIKPTETESVQDQHPLRTSLWSRFIHFISHA